MFFASIVFLFFFIWKMVKIQLEYRQEHRDIDLSIDEILNGH